MGRAGQGGLAAAEQGGGSWATYISTVNPADSPLDSSCPRPFWVECNLGIGRDSRKGEQPRLGQGHEGRQAEGLRQAPEKGPLRLSFEEVETVSFATALTIPGPRLGQGHRAGAESPSPLLLEDLRHLGPLLRLCWADLVVCMAVSDLIAAEITLGKKHNHILRVLFNSFYYKCL